MEINKISKISNKKYTLINKVRNNGFLYKNWRENRQNAFNKLPIYWAFGDNQFQELLKKLNLNDTKEDLKKLVSIGYGGIMRKCDTYLLAEHNRTFSNDILLFWMKNNFNFAYSAFRYEMNNHEYYITYDITETLEALGLNFNDIQNNSGILKLAFLRAKKDYWNACNTYNY